LILGFGFWFFLWRFFLNIGTGKKLRRPAPANKSDTSSTPNNSGDPPNIIIGTALSQYIGFVDFLVHMAPGVIATFIVCVPLILLLYKKSLVGPIPDYHKVLEDAGEYRITNWSLFWKCAFVLGVVVIGFLLHPIHHLE
jgi:Na+/H+ antiporter NhaD/arsenite permease-like protein